MICVAVLVMAVIHWLPDPAPLMRNGEPIALTQDGKACLAVLAFAITLWATEAVPVLVDAEPALPEELFDRAADIWEPLFAIADLAGGNWPERSRAAALVLSAGVNVEDGSLGVLLLKDIKAVLDATGKDRIFTADLLTALCAIDVAPWGDLPRSGKPLDNRSLARLLRDFPIKPTIWKEDGHTVRGYLKDDFLDAWSRYVVGSETSETSATDGEPEAEGVSVVAVVSGKSDGESEGGAERWKF